MSRRFRVTSVLNREPVRAHGLDWARMGLARGIAGSLAAEVEGCFLGEEHDVDWFVRMNNTVAPVDVWAVDEVDESKLVTTSNGHSHLSGVVAAEFLALLRTAGSELGS